MSRWTRVVLAPTVGLSFLLAALLIDLVADIQLSGAYATAAILTSISGRPRLTALVAALAVTAAITSGLWNHSIGESEWAIRLTSCIAAGSAAVVAAHLADRYRQRLRHTNRLAQDLLDALAVELDRRSHRRGGR